METPSPDGFEHLAKAGLTAGMSEEQIQVLAAKAVAQEHSDGEDLVSRDDHEFDLLVVVDGQCEIRTVMNDMLYRLGPYSLIGEVSFVDHKPRSARAIAAGACRTLRIPSSLLDTLESERPDIAARLLKNISIVLCQKLRSTTRFAEASFV